MNARDLWIELSNRAKRMELKGDDYRDENGLIVCGVCGMPRQCLKTFNFDGEEMTLVLGQPCECDEKRWAESRANEERAELARRVGILREASLMDKRLADARFENSEINEENRKSFDLARRYVNKWDQIEKINQGILFWGEPGTGKSHLAACIANALLDREVQTIMTSCIRLTDLIFNSENSETDILGRINRARLLILDDIGTERLTEYSIERIYSIIDSRYRACKPLIVTTNLKLDQMKSETDLQMGRIYSRILEMCYPVKCTGRGFRRKTTAERYSVAKKLLEED